VSSFFPPEPADAGHDGEETAVTHLDLEQLRKQAKERLRERRAAGEDLKLSDVQYELAREHGFASWPKLKEHVGRLGAEQPFRTDLDYYEGRAEGIATVNGVGIAEARRDLARRHGFASWARLVHHVDALREGTEPATPFMQAYEAVEANDRSRLVGLLDRYPDLVRVRGTNGNDLLGMAGDLDLVRVLLERGADPNRGNDYGWTKLHQAGYSNDTALARFMLDAGARTDLFARGDGGTPLVAALFWGNREVARLLGVEPRNLRVWAAKASRVEVLPLLVDLGANVAADPYRGTALAWAAVNDHADAVRQLVELGADPDQRGTFGGPSHGEGVTALHLAAQAGSRDAVAALLDLGADPTLRDRLHDGPAWGWAEFSGNRDIAEWLREHAGNASP
jgi:Ankyrin repeats (3 copies)